MIKVIKIIALIIALGLIHFYFYSSEYIKKIDYVIYDLMMVASDTIETESSFYTVVVDIDEKSLQALGQWPWSRVITANLIEKINELNPSSLGINILFSEVDRISPLNIQKFYKNSFDLDVHFQHLPEKLKDNDALLLNSVLATNATLPIYFTNNSYMKKHCKNIAYHQNIFFKRETDLEANSFLCNHEKLQNKVENFGFINADRDSDGIFRRVPLFIKYEDKVFPSFALATLLSLDSSFGIDSQSDTILLNFPLEKPKVFSALDILQGEVPKEEIQGKIVVLGSSLVGLTSKYKIPTGESVSSSMIHALAIDSILNNSFLIEESGYKKINLLLSLLFILWIWYLFSKKVYIQIIGLLALSVAVSFYCTLYLYLEGVYISIGYFLTPFLSLFILLLVHHIWVINKERTEQEKLFIRQGKLASMGEMIALIAHQWRQPLSAINGTVLNMDMDYRKKRLDGKKLDTYLDDIEQTTAYLSKTINDFTDFFSTNKQAQLIDFSRIMKQVEHLSALSSYKNIQIVVVNKEDIKIQGYSSELIQSLLILLNNAIFICNENIERIGQGRVVVTIVKSGKNVQISVEDNGGGIAKKDMKKIFSPYFTTKDKHNGTGLGLYILKLLIEESMNGKVLVQNGKEGAIFTIELPMNIK